MGSHCYTHTDKKDHTLSTTSNPFIFKLLSGSITEGYSSRSPTALNCTVILYDQTGNHDISPSDIVIAPLPLGTGKQMNQNVLNHHQVLFII